jgi:hypothetical protein
MLPLGAFAQEATLSGTVTDSTGGVLPGVTITATHTATGNTFVAVTDEKGGYRIPVRVGMFKVDAELPGFGTVTRQVELLVGQTAVLNLQMAPSTVQESVTVTGEAPLVDTTTSSLGTNVDPRQMQELPVNGRNWMDLTLLAPGSRANAVAETPINSTSSNIPFQLNLDGQQVTNQVALSFGQPRFSRDAIGEFEFVSNRFDAAQGRSSGIQVNAITKSGTNTPGGTFSGYFRDSKFNGKDPVAGVVLPYQNQQLSTTFGGPIIKDRIHYFLNYEFEREPQTYVYNTPYPKFNTTLSGTRRQDTEMGRFDFQFNPQMRLTARGNRYDNRIPYDSRYTGGSDRTPASAIGTNRRSEQEFGSFTQVLGQSMVNEIKGGHSLFHWNQFAHVNNANSLVGQTSGFGAPVILLRGFTLGQTHAITPQNIREEDWDIQDAFTMSYNAKGRHDMKLGGEYMKDFTWETTCQTCMGQYTANNGALSAAVIQDMIRDVNDVTTWNLAPLSAVTTQYIRNVAMTNSPYSRPTGNNGFTEYAPRHVVAWWAQDDWHATNKLTLNLGVRYDAQIGEFVNWVEFQPFIAGNRPNDLNNIAPRLGFNYAWNDKTVIRGGYGIYYGEATGQPPLFTLRYVQQIAMTVLNDGRPDFAVNPFNGPAPTYDQAKAQLCSSQPNPASPTCNLRHSTQNFAAPDLVDPYSHQASVGFARQIGSTSSLEMDWVYTGDQRRQAELPGAADGVHQAHVESLAGVGELHAVQHATVRSAAAQPGLSVPGDDGGRFGCVSVRCGGDGAGLRGRERLVHHRRSAQPCDVQRHLRSEVRDPAFGSLHLRRQRQRDRAVGHRRPEPGRLGSGVGAGPAARQRHGDRAQRRDASRDAPHRHAAAEADLFHREVQDRRHLRGVQRVQSEEFRSDAVHAERAERALRSAECQHDDGLLAAYAAVRFPNAILENRWFDGSRFAGSPAAANRRTFAPSDAPIAPVAPIAPIAPRP